MWTAAKILLVTLLLSGTMSCSRALALDTWPASPYMGQTIFPITSQAQLSALLGSSGGLWQGSITNNGFPLFYAVVNNSFVTNLWEGGTGVGGGGDFELFEVAPNGRIGGLYDFQPNGILSAPAFAGDGSGLTNLYQGHGGLIQLTNGTATVSNSTIQFNSTVFLTYVSLNGTVSSLFYKTNETVPGVSFKIHSGNSADNNLASWFILP
jgi:hypothetical protein